MSISCWNTVPLFSNQNLSHVKLPARQSSINLLVFHTAFLKLWARGPSSLSSTARFSVILESRRWSGIAPFRIHLFFLAITGAFQARWAFTYKRRSSSGINPPPTDSDWFLSSNHEAHYRYTLRRPRLRLLSSRRHTLLRQIVRRIRLIPQHRRLL